MNLLLTCEQVAALLADYEEGILPLGQFLKVKVHLYNCPECRALLATLRALPGLLGRALTPEDDFAAKAQAALQGALAQLGEPRAPRPWPRTPVPEEAQALLEAGGDLPLRLLAATHQILTRKRQPFMTEGGPHESKARASSRHDSTHASHHPLRLPQSLPGQSPDLESSLGAQHLPQATLDQLPSPELWVWETDGDGLQRAELLADPQGGQRLSLVFAPPGSRLAPHRHLGSESILVLEGAMEDRGLRWAAGSWLHHGRGSSHGPRILASGCWFLVREEGSVRFQGPAGWLRNLGSAG